MKQITKQRRPPILDEFPEVLKQPQKVHLAIDHSSSSEKVTKKTADTEAVSSIARLFES